MISSSYHFECVVFLFKQTREFVLVGDQDHWMVVLPTWSEPHPSGCHGNTMENDILKQASVDTFGRGKYYKVVPELKLEI